MLLAVKRMDGETTDAWRAVLDDLTSRGLRRPQFVIVDGGAGLACALAAVWNDVPVQRCTVHWHRNLLACAPERLHDEITADYTDMIYAATPQDIADRRKAFIRKWRLRHKAVADSLEEAGDALFAFAALPPSQWKSARTTDEMDKHFLTSKARGSLLQVRFLFDRAAGVLSSRPPISQPPRAGTVKAGRVLRGHRKAWP